MYIQEVKGQKFNFWRNCRHSK